MSICFFLHVPSGRSWPTDDPYQWLLDRRDDDLLVRARERLVASPDNPDRVLRVALRRCGLVLVRVVAENKIVVRHWSEPAPDLRAWAKQARFNRAGVAVTLVNAKTGTVVVHEDGLDLLLHGERVGDGCPWVEYAIKYERRQVEEADDQATAPGFTNFIWRGVPPGRLPWRVLKSIWLAEGVPCSNCDVPVLVTTFSWNRTLLSFRSGQVVRHCLRCRRRFEVSEGRPLEWLAGVLEPHLRPDRLRWWREFGIDWSDPAPRLV